ncbi:MAG: hypothetical protein SFU56_12615 [Capsulimonadales bacterium]|nr:hypothetical protein [Capsulimonadales bacterium]
MRFSFFRRSIGARWRVVGMVLPLALFFLTTGVAAQTPPTTADAPRLTRPELLNFRREMEAAVRKAEGGDVAGAAVAVTGAIRAGQARFDLPALPTLFDDSRSTLPAALTESEARAQGVPFWLFEALVRLGAADDARAQANGLTDPSDRFHALCLIGLAQAGRYLTVPYILPPVVNAPPEKWTARSGTGSQVSTVNVVSLQGTPLAPRLDCRPLERSVPVDSPGAFATLGEAMRALEPTRDIVLYRELAEIQGKLGDSNGALLTTQTAGQVAAETWPTVRNDAVRREVVRQQIKLLAADLTALGDKGNARRLEQLLSANAFRQTWLPLLITVNAGLLLIGLLMRRAYRR